MKIAEINIGQRYIAKVSGSLTTVRVLAIREAWTASGNMGPAMTPRMSDGWPTCGGAPSDFARSGRSSTSAARRSARTGRTAGPRRRSASARTSRHTTDPAHG